MERGFDAFEGKSKEEIVSEISELRKNIKKKHRKLKRDMLDSNELWEKKLEPIAAPLKKLMEEGESQQQQLQEYVKQEVGNRKRKLEQDYAESTPTKLYVVPPKQGVKRKTKLHLPSQSEIGSDYDYDVDTFESPVAKRTLGLDRDRMDFQNSSNTEFTEPNEEVDDEMVVEPYVPQTPPVETFESAVSGEQLLKTPEGRNLAKEFIDKTFVGRLAKEYFTNLIKKGKSVDNVYGIRVNGNSWMMGDKVIEVDVDDLIIDDKRYEGTRGLYELIFMNQPNEYVYTDKDLENYASLLNETNAHRINYSKLGKVKSSRGHKYKNIISQIIKKDVRRYEHSGTLSRPGPSRVGTGVKLDEHHGNMNKSAYTDILDEAIKTSGIFTSDSKPKFIYWDDPNELIDRLKLLHASQQAGNTSHENEINAIIEELLEHERQLRMQETNESV